MCARLFERHRTERIGWLRAAVLGRQRGLRYTFNHQCMKALNGDLQMRSDWLLPICNGKERIKVNGNKVHATQKPESLL